MDFTVWDENDGIHLVLKKAGFKKTHSDDYRQTARWKFETYRKGKVNLIVAGSAEFYERQAVATHICKRFNLLCKFHRVFVHEAIRGEVEWSGTEHWNPKMSQELVDLLMGLTGPHKDVLYAAYKARMPKEAKHDCREFDGTHTS
jgi:hypothetical protein